jgi:putative nucleotidyltransferase with HDIG domain
MKEKLLKILPEFNLIEDNALKEKTIEVFEEAIKIGGWEIDDLDKIPFTLLYEPCPASFLEHTRANVLCCISVANSLKEIYKEKVKIDKDILISGAILHDVGKLLEMEKKDGKIVKSQMGKILRHPVSGACLAYKFGIPEKIIHIIANHSKEGEGMKRTIEGVILHHCDFTNFEIF